MSILTKYRKVLCKFDHIGNYSASELAHLKKGDVVKVSHKNETFWVALSVNGGEKLRGKVNNDLFLDHGFDYGDFIEFDAANVVRYESENESSWL